MLPLLLFWGLMTAAFAGQELEHQLQVRLDPAAQRLEVIDQIASPQVSAKPLEFKLHAGLGPSSPTPGVQLELVTTTDGALPLETYRVSLPAGSDSFVLHYAGRIDHPLEAYGKEYARGFRQTPGTLSAQGVYLSGSTYWYPQFGTDNVNFSLQVALPGGWDVVSQGRRLSHQRSEHETRVEWRDETPQQEIFLLAAEFIEYSKPAGRYEAMVFLREADDKLANKYLDVTAQYLEMYEKLLGPYPYSKFALVENFWETGFGMPSFTLLGPKVIRFPFILHSSYPHEILHNWWGNSVYPDYVKGNWAEGLTAYLADHLIKEQRGQGAQHRQAVLQKYSDYVAAGNDFPLTEFTSRHSSVSEAIGYGKALMFFHMLRRQLSDPVFVDGLRRFYRDYRFQIAGFAELRASFERASERELTDQFAQWVERRGAPQLALRQIRVEADGENFKLHGLLTQQQEGAAYRLQVPLALTLAGREQAEQRIIEMSTKRREFTLSLPARPLRIDVDPEFDLFRRLDRNEIPAALSRAFGAEQVLLLLPNDCKPQLRDAYQQLAASWQRFGPESVEIKFDNEVEQLPADRAVALLGWNNRFLPHLRNSLTDFDLELDPQGLRVEKTRIARDGHSLVLTGTHPHNPDLALTWVATEVPAAVPGLARKLPHYHKYSYLAFVGAEPANVLKGRWAVINSPLSQLLPTTAGQSEPVAMGKLAAREPLASLEPLFSKKRMMESISSLAGDDLQGRGVESVTLDKADVRQPVGEQGELCELKNVIGVIPVQNPVLTYQRDDREVAIQVNLAEK